MTNQINDCPRCVVRPMRCAIANVVRHSLGELNPGPGLVDSNVLCYLPTHPAITPMLRWLTLQFEIGDGQARALLTVHIVHICWPALITPSQSFIVKPGCALPVLCSCFARGVVIYHAFNSRTQHPTTEVTLESSPSRAPILAWGVFLSSLTAVDSLSD